MAKIPLVLIAVGVALLTITIISLLVASLGRLNTDQSSSSLVVCLSNSPSVIFQLPFRTTPSRRNSVAMFKRLACIWMRRASSSSSFPACSPRWSSMISRFVARCFDGRENVVVRTLVSQSRRSFDQPRCHAAVSSGSEVSLRHRLAIQRFRWVQKDSLRHRSSSGSWHMCTVSDAGRDRHQTNSDFGKLAHQPSSSFLVSIPPPFKVCEATSKWNYWM